MRRFLIAWKLLGYARRFQASIVNYADDFVVLGKADGTAMLEAVETIMQRLKLPINARKTRCVRCPEEPFQFLGYRIGRNFRPGGRGSYIGTRPSKKSVQSICRKISEQTAARHGLLSIEEMVTRLNWLLTGWANYFRLGQVNPAYACHSCTHDEADSPVALSQAQGPVRGVGALPARRAIQEVWLDMP